MSVTTSTFTTELWPSVTISSATMTWPPTGGAGTTATITLPTSCTAGVFIAPSSVYNSQHTQRLFNGEIIISVLDSHNTLYLCEIRNSRKGVARTIIVDMNNAIIPQEVFLQQLVTKAVLKFLEQHPEALPDALM